ncbi:ABC transporter substrate-binding protein [Rhizosaccharibacter radicis]|uniref:ABC transporter substrate-binding protein n=1 Tax=Rhizosaccharibacter radicis TaxID=2782605 RepID=A0ABT1VTY4_9PROT|nr:ABC transporter substrate-binding protein [Acetobacteraceae bacterium KSS12]
MSTRSRLVGAIAAALIWGAAGVPALAAEMKVGVTVGSLGNPYYAVTNKGIADAVARLTPRAAISVASADYDLGKQFGQIENFISFGARIIMLNAVDPVAIAPAVAKARRAGITVVGFDVAAQGADVTVMTDNVKAGAEACQYIVDHLPGGKGKVVILNGPPISAIVDRVAGCRKVLSAHPGIDIVSSDQNASASREGGLAKGTGLLTRFPKIDAIFAINDPTAIGMELAARQLHRDEFFITSVDGSPDVAKALRAPGALIRASAAQDPYGMAAKAYALGVGIVHGRKPPSPVVLIEPTLVTSENAATYVPWKTDPSIIEQEGTSP